MLSFCKIGFAKFFHKEGTVMAGPQLVVMAAGIGSRYGGLKQIDPVGPSGEIVIDYAIHDALKAGFDKVVFIIRRDIEEAFRRKVGRAIEQRVETAYVFQELDDLPGSFEVPAGRTKPWGTAHAVLCAKDVVTAPFAAINADDFYGPGAFRILAESLRNAEDSDVYDYCMVGYRLGNTLTEHGHVARGVCTASAGGFLAEVVERTKIRRFGDAVKYTEDGENWIEIPADSTVSMNMWGFTPSVFAELESRFRRFLEKNINEPREEFFVPTVVNELVQEARARVRILPTDEKWLGVTYQQDKPRVKEAILAMVRNGDYPERLWS